jgi:hypothetical protein
VNHGGEMVDVLSLGPTSTQVIVDGGSVRMSEMRPLRVVRDVAADRSAVTTVWTATPEDRVQLTQRVTAWRDGATLSLVQQSHGNRVDTVIRPTDGMSLTSLDVRGSEADACFTAIGGSEPCVRIWVAQDDATMQATSDGGLRISSLRTGRLEVLVTALTAGEPAIGLGLLDPAELVEKHDIAAAVLYQPDPAYASRLRRLEAVGFREAMSAGPYRVLVRDDGDGR